MDDWKRSTNTICYGKSFGGTSGQCFQFQIRPALDSGRTWVWKVLEGGKRDPEGPNLWVREICQDWVWGLKVVSILWLFQCVFIFEWGGVDFLWFVDFCWRNSCAFYVICTYFSSFSSFICFMDSFGAMQLSLDPFSSKKQEPNVNFESTCMKTCKQFTNQGIFKKSHSW